jgi:inward rectifier potassium channel
MSWGKFIFVIIAFYLLSNLAFAEAYFLDRGGIENARPDSFADMFYFSVQTMATIGYGKLTPVNTIANILVTIEALWGFTFFAFTTALAFARFSKPTARVLFSDVAVISDYEGKPHLMIRVANQRTNRIANVKAELVILHDGKTVEGYRMRRYYDLPLLRDHAPMLTLTWTLMHRIDENSPLYRVTQEKLREQEDEVIISLSGYDESLSQTIHTRHSYLDDEIVCDARFEDILKRRDDGAIEVNYNLFHSYQKLGMTEQKAD